MRLKYRRLLDELADVADLYLLIQASPDVWRDLALHPIPNDRHFIFDVARLPRSLGYSYLSGRSPVPGSTHFPLLAWSRTEPRFTSLLVIEYDVEFSGNWRDLLVELETSSSDFVALHFRRHRFDPQRYWWRALKPAWNDLHWAHDRRNFLRSFNPVYFMSRRAVDLVEAAHRRGWRGHYEALLATVLSRRGCRLADVRDLGAFYQGTEQDMRSGMPAEMLSTMRWRPEVTAAEFLRRSTGNTLFHPVKRGWLFDGERIVSVDAA